MKTCFCDFVFIFINENYILAGWVGGLTAFSAPTGYIMPKKLQFIKDVYFRQKAEYMLFLDVE